MFRIPSFLPMAVYCFLITFACAFPQRFFGGSTSSEARDWYFSILVVFAPIGSLLVHFLIISRPLRVLAHSVKISLERLRMKRIKFRSAPRVSDAAKSTLRTDYCSVDFSTISAHRKDRETEKLFDYWAVNSRFTDIFQVQADSRDAMWEAFEWSEQCFDEEEKAKQCMVRIEALVEQDRTRGHAQKGQPETDAQPKTEFTVVCVNPCVESKIQEETEGVVRSEYRGPIHATGSAAASDRTVMDEPNGPRVVHYMSPTSSSPVEVRSPLKTAVCRLRVFNSADGHCVRTGVWETAPVFQQYPHPMSAAPIEYYWFEQVPNDELITARVTSADREHIYEAFRRRDLSDAEEDLFGVTLQMMYHPDLSQRGTSPIGDVVGIVDKLLRIFSSANSFLEAIYEVRFPLFRRSNAVVPVTESEDQVDCTPLVLVCRRDKRCLQNVRCTLLWIPTGGGEEGIEKSEGSLFVVTEIAFEIATLEQVSGMTFRCVPMGMGASDHAGSTNTSSVVFHWPR